MKDERYQREGDIREGEESGDGEGEICDDIVATKGEDDETCEKQEHGEE